MITWNYDSETDSATAMTDTGMSFGVDFNSGEVTVIYCGDFDIYPDTFQSRNTYFKIDGDFVLVEDLVKNAESEYENMLSEAKEEDGRESQYQSDVSSLEFIGRV